MKKISTAILFVGLMALMSSCISEIFKNQSKNSGDAILSNVSSDFDWSTVTSVSLNVVVTDEFNAAYLYTVEVFDKNPIVESGAKLLTQGYANQDQAFQTSLSVPQGTTSLFVRQTTPQGLSSVKSVTVARFIDLNFAAKSASSPKVAEVTAFAKTSMAVTPVVAASVYASVIPADAIAWDSKGGGSSKKYFIKDGSYNDVNVWKGDCNLYISGKVTINTFYCGTKTTLYLLPGSEVTIVKSYSASQQNTIFSVNTGAKLSFSNGLQIGNKATLNNKGAIVTPSYLQVGGSGTLYNEAGTIEVGGLLSGENEKSVILNYGSILTSNFTLAGNSTFTNGGTVTVSGLTQVNSKEAAWRNESGLYTTQNMTIIASNPNSYNGCKLVVNHNLTLSDVPFFTMGAESSVSCEYLSMKNARVNLGSKALFKVNQEASYSYNPRAKGFGFYGTDATAALLILKKVINAGKNDIIHYGGNLQVECSSHPNLVWDAWNTIYTIESTVAWFGEGKSTLVIPSSGCSEGHSAPSTGGAESPTFPALVQPVVTYTYAAEDLWPDYGDYDMNDLVLTMKPSYYLSATNNVTTLILTSTLKAVGATKSLSAAVQLDNILSDKIESVSYVVGRSNLNGSVFDIATSGNEADQVHAVIPLFDNAHQFLGVSQNMTNTIIGGQSAAPQTFTITITFKESAGVTINDIDISKLNFFMVTDQKKTARTEVHLRGYEPTDKASSALFNTGVDAYSTVPYSSKDNLVWIIMVPEDISFPTENTSILKAYPTFKAWATSSGSESVLWYQSPDQTYIYK